MILSGERYDEIEEEIVDFIVEMNLDRYPIDIFGILLTMGICVKPYSSIPQSLRDELLPAFPNAFTLRPDNFDASKTTIYYNDSHKYERIRFSLAHELVHIILEHPSDDEPYESEANYGARYLLAPWPVVIAHSKLDIWVIQDDFNVGYECAGAILTRSAARKRSSAAYRSYELEVMNFCKVEGRWSA